MVDEYDAGHYADCAHVYVGSRVVDGCDEGIGRYALMHIIGGPASVISGLDSEPP